MEPTLTNVNQLSRVLDLSPAAEPAFVFMIGAAGSGKSTLATNLRSALGRIDTAVAKFDDSERWGMSRWEAHQHEFPNFESCATHFIAEWIAKVAAEYQDKKLVLCDVNTTPDILQAAIERAGVRNCKVALVQPCEELRAMRLANDPTRQAMDRDTFKGQLNSDFATFLAHRSEELGIPRILNEDSQKSLSELSSICAQGIRTAV